MMIIQCSDKPTFKSIQCMGFTVETMVKCPAKLLPEILKKSLFRQFRENGRVWKYWATQEMAVWPISDHFPRRLGVSWRWEKENRVSLQDWYWVWQYDVSPQWWTFHGENDEICHPFLGTPDKAKAIKPSRPIWICKSAEPWYSHDIFP